MSSTTVSTQTLTSDGTKTNPIVNDCEYVLDIEQGTPEWLALRADKVTGTVFNSFSYKTNKDGSLSATSRSGLEKIASKVLYGQPIELTGTALMTVGKVLEPALRKVYEALNPDLHVQEVGFIKSKTYPFAAYSPDGVLFERDDYGRPKPEPIGLLELKNVTYSTFLEAVRTGQADDKYAEQALYGLMLTGLDYIDLVYGCPQAPSDRCFWFKRFTKADITQQMRDKLEAIGEEIAKQRQALEDYTPTMPCGVQLGYDTMIELAAAYKKRGVLVDQVAHFVTNRDGLEDDYKNFNSVSEYLSNKAEFEADYDALVMANEDAIKNAKHNELRQVEATQAMAANREALLAQMAAAGIAPAQPVQPIQPLTPSAVAPAEPFAPLAPILNESYEPLPAELEGKPSPFSTVWGGEEDWGLAANSTKEETVVEEPKAQEVKPVEYLTPEKYAKLYAHKQVRDLINKITKWSYEELVKQYVSLDIRTDFTYAELNAASWDIEHSEGFIVNHNAAVYREFEPDLFEDEGYSWDWDEWDEEDAALDCWEEREQVKYYDVATEVYGQLVAEGLLEPQPKPKRKRTPRKKHTTATENGEQNG